jgi:hypothetical protein
LPFTSFIQNKTQNKSPLPLSSIVAPHHCPIAIAIDRCPTDKDTMSMQLKEEELFSRHAQQKDTLQEIQNRLLFHGQPSRASNFVAVEDLHSAKPMPM